MFVVPVWRHQLLKKCQHILTQLGAFFINSQAHRGMGTANVQDPILHAGLRHKGLDRIGDVEDLDRLGRCQFNTVLLKAHPAGYIRNLRHEVNIGAFTERSFILKYIIVFLIAFSLLGITACKDEGSLEKAGKKVDKFFEDLGDE